MTLYCVETPWWGCSTPDEHPRCFRWFQRLRDAKAWAVQRAAEIEWDNDWLAVYAGGAHHMGCVVTREDLPKKSKTDLALWMARNATRPTGPVVFVAPVPAPTQETE